jgi:hypothetical protein
MAELAAILLIVALALLVVTLQSPWGQLNLGADPVEGYLPGAQRFLDTGSPYLPDQIAGPWALGAHSFIHPPSALPLFIPFLILPYGLWWAVPIVVTVLAIVWLRPAPWTWPLMAACLCWPRSTGSLIAGNTDMWSMAAVAAGAAWGLPIVILAIKPTFAPLALVAVRRRSAWIAGAVLAVLMLPLLHLWFDWLQVIGNASLSWTYSLLNLPLVLIGLIAWVGRTRGRPQAGATSEADPVLMK